MNKTGGEAARLVKAVSSKASKLGRRAKPPALAPQTSEPAAALVETDGEPAVSELHPIPTIDMSQVDAVLLAPPQIDPIAEPEEPLAKEAAPAQDVFEARARSLPRGIGDPGDVPPPEPTVHEIAEHPALGSGGTQEVHDPAPASAPLISEGGDPLSEVVATNAVALVEAESEDAVVTTDAVMPDVGMVREAVAEAVRHGEEVVPHAAPTGAASTDAIDVMQDLGDRVARRIQGNIDSSIAFWISMMQVKSPAEAIELNTAHLRYQVASFVSQCEDLGGLARGPWMLPWRLWSGARADHRSL